MYFLLFKMKKKGSHYNLQRGVRVRIAKPMNMHSFLTVKYIEETKQPFKVESLESLQALSAKKRD